MARARRQGRPVEVMPWQVVVGFLESVRARRDSGVCGMKGMAWVGWGGCRSSRSKGGGFGREVQWTRESKVGMGIGGVG